jgi:hypothetical protein
MNMGYIEPEKKELFIVHNDPKRPALHSIEKGPWPNLPEGCWAPKNVVEYYHIDWNNPNSDGPFISDITGGTITPIRFFFIKLFGRIKKPNKQQKEEIEKYKLYEMIKKFYQERIDAGWIP